MDNPNVTVSLLPIDKQNGRDSEGDYIYIEIDKLVVCFNCTPAEAYFMLQQAATKILEQSFYELPHQVYQNKT